MKHLSDKEITLELKKHVLAHHHIHSSSFTQEWILFWELNTKSGLDPQYVDAFAINTFPSKKFKRIAYELKASRSDLMKELKNPQKREWAVTHSHQFYFLCPEHIVTVDEIPTECGLMLIKNNKLIIEKRAPINKNVQSFTENELVAMLKRHYLQNGIEKEVLVHQWQEMTGILKLPKNTQILVKYLNNSICSAVIHQ